MPEDMGKIMFLFAVIEKWKKSLGFVFGCIVGLKRKIANFDYTQWSSLRTLNTWWRLIRSFGLFSGIFYK